MSSYFLQAQRSAICAALFSAFGLALTAGAARADSVAGVCQYKGTSITWRDGVVYREASPFDETKQDIVVALATISLDKLAISKAADKDDALRAQVWASDAAASVKLHIDQGTVTAVHYSAGGTSLSQSGNDVGKLSLKGNDATHLDGSFKLDGDGKDDMACTLSFNLSYTDTQPASAAGTAGAAGGEATTAVPAGKALPAGGGEPGKAFAANLAAMQKGDIDGMLATVSRSQAERMRAQQSDPNFAAMLGMMKAFAPKSARITGGQESGDRAELTIDAVDQSGKKASGTSHLVKEDGKWKVEKTSMKSGDDD